MHKSNLNLLTRYSALKANFRRIVAKKLKADKTNIAYQQLLRELK